MNIASVGYKIPKIVNTSFFTLSCLIICYITCNTYNETNSSLYLLKAIRRLSMDSPKLTHEISKVLNKVFVDGCEINKMMDEIKQFQKEAEKSEYNLDKLEGKVIRIEIIIIY